MIDLHLHMDGSLTPELVGELAAERSIRLPVPEGRTLAQSLRVPDSCRSLNDVIRPVFTCLFWFFQDPPAVEKAFDSLCRRLEAARSGLCRDPFRAPAPSEKRLHPGGDHRGRNPRNCPERIFCRADPLLYAWKRQRSRKSGNIRDSLPPPGQGCGSRRPGRCRGSLSHQGFFRSVCQSCGSGSSSYHPCRRGRRPGQRRLRRQLWRGTDSGMVFAAWKIRG